MAFTSTTGSKEKAEIMDAFDGIAPSAPTSASNLMKKPSYDVFINHRGPDVKSTLASALYGILTGMALSVFLDAPELEYGDFLPRTIEAAMSSALVHIAIFSERYAESPWCLAELSFMLKSGAPIIPIFFCVDPDDLRCVDQDEGKYVEAFKHHKKKCRYSPEQLEEWKVALFKVSYYSGEVISNKDYEKSLLKTITSCVLREINVNVPLEVAKYPVGLEETVKDFEMNALQSAEGDQGVQIIGIWGMGGSGKTTLAKELYNKRSSLIKRSSFVFNVRDASSKVLLLKKQEKILKDLNFEDVSSDDIKNGMDFLSNCLRSVRILIVLDDVDNVEQLDALLPMKDSVERGSLIIVTTRDYDVLKSWGISSIYKMRALDVFHAEQLFCWHAFAQPFPRNGFEKLVRQFSKVCNGLPLSLMVVGGQLYGELRKECWEDLLHKISKILPNVIQHSLKISYDILDDKEKEMFLDIACFFVGEEISLAIEVWNGLGWSGQQSWTRLLHKCLIELDNNNCIQMPEHLKDMGRHIANKQSPYRIWFPHQIIDVQKQKEERISLQGIMASTQKQWIDNLVFLHLLLVILILCRSSLSKFFGFVYVLFYFLIFLCFSCIQKGEGKPLTILTEITESSDKVDEFSFWCSKGKLMVETSRGIWRLSPSLVGLKFLAIRGDYFNQIIGEVSRELVWLRWFQIGQKSLPPKLSLEKLRVLELHEGEAGDHHLEKLWTETDGEVLVQLRVLVICQCYKLQGFPNSIGSLNHLKKIVIIKAYEVVSLPEEFSLLQSLEHLVLCDCSMLSSLPSSFGNLNNLRHLCIFGCGELRKLPVSFKNLMLLEYLNLGGCSELGFTPEDLNILENMTEIKILSLVGCEKVQELPYHIINQESLKELYLRGTSLRELPVNIGQLSGLKEMVVGSVLLTSLPDSLGDLSSLTNLSICGCPQLTCLPDSVGDLNLLKELEINNVGVNSLPKSVRQLNGLRRLIISGCPISKLDFGAAFLPFALSNLKWISLKETEVCRISIFENCCPSLETLTVENNCHLVEIDALPTTLKSLKLTECKMLKNIPSFVRTTSLRELEVRGCHQIEKIEGLEYCRTLENLRVDTCREVPGIESLEYMEKLKELQLRANKGSAIERCIQTIQKWPDIMAICTRAVPGACSLVDSLLPRGLFVVDSFSNKKIQSRPRLLHRHSSNGNATILCFVLNCVSSQMTLGLDCRDMRDGFSGVLTKVEKGRWAWVGVFTQRYEGSLFISEELSISGYGGNCAEEDEMEKGLVVSGEEQTAMEAVRSLLPLFESCSANNHDQV
ncbi:disease resistance protein RPV1 isoform X2 [Cryptomeria japonica]|uniref:disease resistance protein RPV1 isoform X2 n=1 Tax=Cryptomeria japonica TaxID=3369 RepID=UPI0027DA8038|nr:disease resistance protein RPV1 isoform X2 [Cryptomeria japonica]